MKALIFGVNGQDGAYLASFLLKKGYQVIGSSRDAMASSFTNLKKLGLYEDVQKISVQTSDFRSTFHAVKKYLPDEIYNLSAQSSVALSFDQPVETIESIAIGTLNILEAIRFSEKNIKLYNASSSECFGDQLGAVATENTNFNPCSPYAVAKVTAHNLIRNYLHAYGIFGCNGLLFNHESPLRPERYVTQKIISTALLISQGRAKKLELGNIGIIRDWGWAPDYVEAMWLMLQLSKPQDFIIATGRSVSLEYFISRAFEFFNLNYSDYLESNKDLFRPYDLMESYADPSKARDILGWTAKNSVEDVINKMCNAIVNEE